MQHTRTQQKRSRSGFTLVEMLVSVTLILLLMTMFASIFQVATDSVRTTRDISERDQKIRAVTTVIRNDLAKRTMRYTFPFYPNEDISLGPRTPDARDGYFYLSCNLPDVQIDNLLQFTVDARITAESDDTTPYFGASLEVEERTGTTPARNLFTNPNQPEVDDGSLTADGAASSPVAEISYFIRDGNLYRRVVLLRSPRRIAGADLAIQPTGSTGGDLFAGLDRSVDPPVYDGLFASPDGLTSNDFWRFFDFSAIPNNPGVGTQSAQFIGIDALSNQISSSGVAAPAVGNPVYRFGFNSFGSTSYAPGLSREHDSNTAARFIGRFVHGETSNTNFNYPMNASTVGNGNPFDLVETPLTLDGNTGQIQEFAASGPRILEDLLLAGVQQFNVEIWDERVSRFVVPGYGSSSDGDAFVGDYHIRRNLNFQAGEYKYGPLGTYNNTSSNLLARQPRVFDTWHPVVANVAGGGRIDFDRDSSIGGMSEIQPPYIPYLFHPPRQNDPSSPTDTGSGPSSPQAPAADATYWQPDVDYVEGDVVFARLNTTNPPLSSYSGWDLNGNGFNWLEDAVGPGPNLQRVIPRQGFQIAYRCVVAGRSGTVPPAFPDSGGRRVAEVATGGEPVWVSFDNRSPLRAIRITLQFINDNTGEPRQTTMVIPMSTRQ